VSPTPFGNSDRRGADHPPHVPVMNDTLRIDAAV
jgi:hypothetical protein